MKKAQRDQWCEALRSGEYKQCYGVYHSVIGERWSHCAIGVLEAVLFPNSKPWSRTNRSCIWNLISDGEYIIITDMNDSGDKDFPAIADWIEANVSLEE